MCFAVLSKSSGSDTSRPLLPADRFLDLPQLDAIFGSEIVYGFPGIESGSDDRSRDAGARDHRLPKTHRRIDLDQPGLVLRSLHDERVELEETSGIVFDALQVMEINDGSIPVRQCTMKNPRQGRENPMSLAEFFPDNQGFVPCFLRGKRRSSPQHRQNGLVAWVR